MKKILISVIFISILLASDAISAEDLQLHNKSKDLLRVIVNETNSQIVEYGLKTTFKAENNSEKECVDIYNRLIGGKESECSVFQDSNAYCLQFKSKETTGFIESRNIGGTREITIDIIEHKESYGLDELKNRIDKAIGSRTGKIKYYQYVKGRLENSDPAVVNDLITDILKGAGASNINTINLGNALGTTALTGNFEKLKSGGIYIDFNSAVCSYESGNYLVIGTPVILSTY